MLLLEVDEANSAAVHRLFATQPSQAGRTVLCVSGRAGPSVCRLLLTEGAVGQGVQRGVTQSQQGQKVGEWEEWQDQRDCSFRGEERNGHRWVAEILI